MKSLISSIALLLFVSALCGQNWKADSIQIRNIYDQVLLNGDAYNNLRNLCKDIGHRLTGSKQAEKAVDWGKLVLNKYGLDKVWLQEIRVPFWERGDTERLDFLSNSNELYTSNCTALGGSIGTDRQVLTGEIIEINSWEMMKDLGTDHIKGKFVFIIVL